MATIIIAGDYSPKDRIAQLIEADNTSGIFAGIKDVLSQSDYSIVNFESAVTTANSKLIKKAGPGMHCTAKAVELLKKTGFDAVTLANNHFRDYGDEGVNNTVQELKKNDIEYFGGGKNIDEAERTFFKDVNGNMLAFISVCEHEFSIASSTRGGAAPLDVIDVSRRIVEAKKQADFVIVIVHGGNEHYQLPSPRLKKTYRYFVEMGADAVINHHQHCFSGYEVYDGKPIFYGLGNFCFDWNGRRNMMWNEGYMVKLTLDETVNFEIIPYIQCDEEPAIGIMRDEKRDKFDERIAELNQIIVDDDALEKSYDDFVQKRKSTIILPFTAYLTSYARRAAGHNILPCLIPKSKLVGQINFIECESHRDVLLKVLNEKLEK